MWPDTRLRDLFSIDHPIIQAPMAGASSPDMALAVSAAGGLSSLACATLDAESLRDYCGQAAPLGRRTTAFALTRDLASNALRHFQQLAAAQP